MTDEMVVSGGDLSGGGLVGSGGSEQQLFRRCIVVATLIGAAVRVSVLISKWNQELLVNDSLYYLVQASNNAHGRWFREFWGVEQGAEHAPLTSLILTPVGLLDDPLPWMRLTMTVIGVCVVPLIGLLGYRIGGQRVGVVAAVVAALYPNLWMSDSLIMSETIANALIVLTLLAAVHYRDRFTWRAAALVGALVGLAGLTRAEVLIFSPLLALIGFRREAMAAWAIRASAVVIATVLVILPWVAFNFSRFDAPVLMSTNEGATLLGANCAESYGGPGIGGWSILCLHDPIDRPGEDTAERSIRQRGEAIDYANGHRSRLPIVAAARLLRAADLFGWSDLVRSDEGEERYTWSIWAGMVCWWVLAPLAVAGWWRSRRTYGLILATPAICVFVTAVLFYGAHRLRSPIESVIVVAAAAFITRVAPVQRMIDRWLARQSAHRVFNGVSR